MLRLASVLALACGVAAHGSGAWKDPNHFDASVPSKGMRYISETKHVLTMVGTDDGLSWWHIVGAEERPQATRKRGW